MPEPVSLTVLDVPEKAVEPGSLVRLEVYVQMPAADGYQSHAEFVNPDTIRVRALGPDGADEIELPTTPREDSVGQFFFDVPVDASGPWNVRVEVSGSFVAATEVQLIGKATEFDTSGT